MILSFFCITETTFAFLLKQLQGFLVDVSQMSIVSLCSKILMLLLELQWETSASLGIDDFVGFPFSVHFPEINPFSSDFATLL